MSCKQGTKYLRRNSTTFLPLDGTDTGEMASPVPITTLRRAIMKARELALSLTRYNTLEDRLCTLLGQQHRAVPDGKVIVRLSVVLREEKVYQPQLVAYLYWAAQ